jgi:hypothetical protein
MRANRIKLHGKMQKGGYKNDYKHFLNTFFKDKNSVAELHEVLTKGGDYTKDLPNFYREYVCGDLRWASGTPFCKDYIKELINREKRWKSDLSCVATHKDAQKIKLGDGTTAYKIGNTVYFNTGRKSVNKQMSDYSCNDLEFKTSTGSGNTDARQPFKRKYVSCAGTSNDPFKKLCYEKDPDGPLHKVQACIGVTPDGKFWEKTEEALVSKIGKNSFTIDDVNTICGGQTDNNLKNYKERFSVLSKKVEDLANQKFNISPIDTDKVRTSSGTNTSEIENQTVTTGTETNTQPQGITQPINKHNPASADF